MDISVHSEDEFECHASKMRQDIRSFLSRFPYAPAHEVGAALLCWAAIPAGQRGSRKARFIATDHLQHRTGRSNSPSIDPNTLIAQTPNLVHLMADEDNRASTVRNLLHFAETLFLKLDISHCQHFINEQNLRRKVCGDGEGQPHLHTGAEMLKRSVDIALDAGEIHDRIVLLNDFPLAHSQNRAT